MSIFEIKIYGGLGLNRVNPRPTSYNVNKQRKGSVNPKQNRGSDTSFISLVALRPCPLRPLRCDTSTLYCSLYRFSYFFWALLTDCCDFFTMKHRWKRGKGGRRISNLYHFFEWVLYNYLIIYLFFMALKGLDLGRWWWKEFVRVLLCFGFLYFCEKKFW